MVFTNYYKTLDIAVDASAADIKAAYRSMSKRFHPDMNADDSFFEARFKDVQEAYRVLSDPKARSLYDRVFMRYRADGFVSGNTILIPDESAGKRAYSWHPDYRAAKMYTPVSTRSAMFIGLAVILVVGFCTWFLQQRDPPGAVTVDDADLYVGTSQRPRIDKQEKRPAPVRAGTRVDPEAPGIQVPLMAEPSPLPGPVTAPARMPVLEPAKAQQLRNPPPASPEALALRIPGAHPEALLASSGRMPVGRPAPLPEPMFLAPERMPAFIPAVTRKDTDRSDLMVRRVRDVRYGYSVVVIRRTYHFKDRRPDQSRTIRYGSNVLLFKLSDLADREALLQKAVAVCIRMESAFTFTETFTATAEIVDQALKTFDTQAEAQAALKLESVATSMRM